jgi:hypothetical protein
MRDQWDLANIGEFRKEILELIYASLGTDYFMHSYIQKASFLSYCLSVFLLIQCLCQPASSTTLAYISLNKFINANLLLSKSLSAPLTLT